MKDKEVEIIHQLNQIQGTPVDIGGYYMPNLKLAYQALRPSETFNSILKLING
jgi:isocitrate dehydrogenase